MSDEPQIEVLERGQGPNVSSDIDLNEQLAAATETLKGLQATERLSGLGRFASKVQKFFQASLPSKFKSAPRLRAAPSMMLAGVLLLTVTGFLFVVSKPVSSTRFTSARPSPSRSMNLRLASFQLRFGAELNGVNDPHCAASSRS